MKGEEQRPREESQRIVCLRKRDEKNGGVLGIPEASPALQREGEVLAAEASQGGAQREGTVLVGWVSEEAGLLQPHWVTGLWALRGRPCPDILSAPSSVACLCPRVQHFFLGLAQGHHTDDS